MTVYRSVQHECLFAQEVADGAKGPAQYLRLCNVLCWIAGTVALASTVDDIHPLLVAGSLGLISSALELTGWRQLRLVSCWHRCVYPQALIYKTKQSYLQSPSTIAMGSASLSVVVSALQEGNALCLLATSFPKSWLPLMPEN